MDWKTLEQEAPALNQRVIVWVSQGPYQFEKRAFWGHYESTDTLAFFDNPQNAHRLTGVTHWSPVISPDGQAQFN